MSTSPRPLLLAVHGAGDRSTANLRAVSLAQSLRGRWPGPVDAAFQKGNPSFSDALVTADTVVVPLLAAEGYYARRRLPDALIREREQGARSPVLAPALGTRTELVDTVIEQLVAAEQPVQSVVVAAHGTRRDGASGRSAEALAASIAQRWPKALVRVGYLDQEPALEHVLRSVGEPVFLVPWMWGAADHAEKDVPEALAKAEVEALVLPPLVEAPALERVVLAAAREAVERTPLRLGTFAEELELAQSRIVQERLAGVGCPTILEARSDDPSSRTESLEAMLLTGEIDLAVHRLEDLPADRTRDRGDFVLAALLPRGAAGDVLVSRRGTSLEDLPLGARLVVSTASRQLQLQRQRRDLEIEIRSVAVAERASALLATGVDAAVVSEADLLRRGLEHVVAQRLPSLVPAPGQGVLAVQVRSDDDFARRLVGRVDHPSTRRAVEAELDVVRQAPDGALCAAHAVDFDGALRLEARWLDGERVVEAWSGPANARRVIDEVCSKLLGFWTSAEATAGGQP
ncbi:MAG: CbiX/SirB N-terminal domain-containing protein [Acidobacteriota bacterium]